MANLLTYVIDCGRDITQTKIIGEISPDTFALETKLKNTENIVDVEVGSNLTSITIPLKWSTYKFSNSNKLAFLHYDEVITKNFTEYKILKIDEFLLSILEEDWRDSLTIEELINILEKEDLDHWEKLKK